MKSLGVFTKQNKKIIQIFWNLLMTLAPALFFYLWYDKSLANPIEDLLQILFSLSLSKRAER